MITILLQKIIAALTQLLGDIKTKLNTIKDNLDNLIVVATASGHIASFTTTITKPFIALSVEIKPKQASGTPTPSNPLPISGTDTVVITQTDGDNQVITTKTVSLPETVYGGEVDVIGGSGTSNYTLANLSDLSWENAEQSGKTIFFAVIADKINNVDNIAYCEIFASATSSGTSLATAASLLTSDFMICTSKNTTSPRIYVRADGYTGTQFANAISGYKVAYQVATPTPITLANPITITALNGVNNIFSDSGNVTVEYLKLYKEV